MVGRWIVMTATRRKLEQHTPSFTMTLEACLSYILDVEKEADEEAQLRLNEARSVRDLRIHEQAVTLLDQTQEIRKLKAQLERAEQGWHDQEMKRREAEAERDDYEKVLQYVQAHCCHDSGDTTAESPGAHAREVLIKYRTVSDCANCPEPILKSQTYRKDAEDHPVHSGCWGKEPTGGA